MGFALSGVNQLTALSTPYRVFQGITDPGEIQDVGPRYEDPDGARDRDHQSRAATTPASAASGWSTPTRGRPLYLDYRSGTGQDAGSAYLARWALGCDQGNVRYAPGVTINALRDGSGVDTLVLDGSGDTSLGAGTRGRTRPGRSAVHVSTLTPPAPTSASASRPRC